MNHDNAPIAASQVRLIQTCQYCGTPLEGLEIAPYCSPSCRQQGERRRGATPPRSTPLAQQLKLNRSYDWSNPHLPEDAFLLRVLEGADIADIAQCVKHFGGARMLGLLNKIRDPLTLAISGRKLQNVIAALEPQHAQTRRFAG